MKLNQWTLALAVAGVVSLGSVIQAEEGQSQVLTALSQTTLSGYIDTSAIWQPGSQSRGGALPGRTFDGADRVDGFNLHAVKLTLERPLDEAEFSAGYKADLVFGPDANFYSTLLNQNGVDADDFAIKQAFVALRAPVGNGLDLKLGAWDTLIGYEVFESGNNPNFSRSYGFLLEPRNHVGVLASYHINDMISVAAGVANTFRGPINDRGDTESQKTFLGSITVTLPEAAGVFAGSTLYAGVVDGQNGITSAGRNGQDTTSYYLGFTMTTPMEGLAVGAALDYRDDGVRDFLNPGTGVDDDNWAWSAAGYVSFQALEKLRLNARADYLRGSIGTFYVSGDENELGSLTLTADYSLWDNVTTRAEVRWDHAFEGAPYDGDDKNALTLAANLIYKF